MALLRLLLRLWISHMFTCLKNGKLCLIVIKVQYQCCESILSTYWTSGYIESTLVAADEQIYFRLLKGSSKRKQTWVFIVLSTTRKLITPKHECVSNISNYSHSNYSYCCCSASIGTADGSINVNQLIKTEKSNSINNKFQKRVAYLQISDTKNNIIIKIVKKASFPRINWWHIKHCLPAKLI